MAKYIIENRYITPFFSEKFKYIPEKKDNTNFFEHNKTYLLTGLDCDGFSMPTKRYKYVCSIDEVDGIRLNSVIMKQIGGDQTTIFSLTKSDCKYFGIEFESGLQLFPNNLGWVKEKQDEDVTEIFFDSENLSTYPVDYKDKTIHFMIVKLSGFSYDYLTRMIYMPNGDGIHESVLVKHLNIRALRNIGITYDMDNICVGMNEYIPYRIITDKASRVKKIGQLVDIGGCIFIELCFEQYLNNVKRGIKPIHFSNESFDKFFEISINLDCGMTSHDRAINRISMYRDLYDNMKYSYVTSKNLNNYAIRNYNWDIEK